MLGIQIIQKNLLGKNIPAMAKEKAKNLKWNVSDGCSNPYGQSP